MALFANYSIANEDVYLVTTVRWKLTSGGAIVHTDQWRVDLTDRAAIEGGPQGVADRLVRQVKARAREIDTGIQVYQGVAAALSQPQNTDFQII